MALGRIPDIKQGDPISAKLTRDVALEVFRLSRITVGDGLEIVNGPEGPPHISLVKEPRWDLFWATATPSTNGANLYDWNEAAPAEGTNSASATFNPVSFRSSANRSPAFDANSASDDVELMIQYPSKNELRYAFIRPGQVYPVRVEKTGGSDGTATSAASWTYSIRPYGGGTNTLATNLPQVKPRPNGFTQFQTGSNGVGIAFRSAGAYQLWDAGEKPTCGSTNTATLGGSSEGSEAADSSSASGPLQQLTLNLTSRVGYFESGDQTLYGYARTLTFKCESGRLWLSDVSAETRYTVDVPGPCS